MRNFLILTFGSVAPCGKYSTGAKKGLSNAMLAGAIPLFLLPTRSLECR